MWDAGAAGGALACYSTVLVPRTVLFKVLVIEHFAVCGKVKKSLNMLLLLSSFRTSCFQKMLTEQYAS